MQDENTLRELGFRGKPSLHIGEFLFRGKHQKFIAKASINGSFPYVALYMVSPKVDTRPLSVFKGHYFRNIIKDCCSNGSVERAIAKYDLPEDQINRTGITVTIKNTVNV